MAVVLQRRFGAAQEEEELLPAFTHLEEEEWEDEDWEEDEEDWDEEWEEEGETEEEE